MDNYIDTINYALDNSKIRLGYYSKTNDERFMSECKDWLRVVDIYLNEIIRNQKNENSYS